MAFIEKSDYADVIRENILDDITEVNDNIITSCQKRAISFLKGYLNSRYDVNAIFSKTGDDRSSEVLGYAKDITVYYLHRQVNARKIPIERSEAYKEALDWLRGVLAGEINPDLPKTSGESKDFIQFGSNPKRSNHI